MSTIVQYTSDNLLQISQVIGAVSVIAVMVKKWGGKVQRSAKNLFLLPSHIRQSVELGVAKLDVLESNQAAMADKLIELTTLVTALKDITGYNGGGGLMDKVGFILGFQANNFWHTSHPGFICNAQGDYLECTQGYCRLLGLKNKTDLSRRSWQGFVEKSEFNGYLAEFVDVASRCEIFRRPLHLFDASGKTIGEWLIVACPLSSEGAKTVRYIGFLYPACPISKQAAIVHNWPMYPPL